jgi:hypothetical protein
MPTEHETGRLLMALASAPDRIAQAVANMPPSQQRTSLAQGEWSAAQLFAHIRASDDVLAYRCIMILSQDHPRYHDLDERRWEEAMHYADLDFLASLQSFASRRAELIQMLQRASSSDWQRGGAHAQHGEQTLWRVAVHLSEHEEEHIEQLQAIARRWVLLRALTRGLRLKDHRDLEGHKGYVLHQLDEAGEPVSSSDVEALVGAGLISSNKKFPAATYWLTEAGNSLIAIAN